MSEPLIFEISVTDRRGYWLPESDVPSADLSRYIPQDQLRVQAAELPEVAEFDVVRHYTRLSQSNFSVDTHFYPLGSCTMKYNPRINERVAAMSGFAAVHPLQPADQVQGTLQLLFELQHLLCEITGMDAFTLQPAAGAQGELTGLKIIAAYHKQKRCQRRIILIPDSAHGTNPASAALSGFEVVQIKSGSDGLIDLNDLKKQLSGEVAALMLTNPNTLGLFEKEIKTICAWVHDQGALVYMDGANMNALLAVARPGDMDVDVLQLNLHKTFSTPHGGGGPGAGPIGVAKKLEDYLPIPRLRKQGNKITWDEGNKASVGRVHGYFGNVGVLVRAYVYIRTLGREGIERVSRVAIINANYLRVKLHGTFNVPFDQPCMHEFVMSLKELRVMKVTAWDVAKRLLDYGFYAPTVYFPLIVDEAFMIEPTETESKETLDAFIAALLAIAEEAKIDPDTVRNAPQHLDVTRINEAKAAREPNLRWQASSAHSLVNVI